MPFLFLWLTGFTAISQDLAMQQGLLLKSGGNIRLGSVQVINKRSRARTKSGYSGVFNIPAKAGDTLSFSGNNIQLKDVVVTDLADMIIYLEPAIQLNEVIVQETAFKSDIKEVMRGYREKSVFYNGTPHYYYLLLKPMTFIYENFKSEKIFARRFNKFANQELAAYEVAERFNDASIKQTIPIANSDLKDFKLNYTPSQKQLQLMSDYDLIHYIKNCYADFKRNRIKKDDNKI